MLQEAFAALDEDGQGRLGPLELSIAMSSLGYAQGAVEAVVGRGDHNRDGQLDFDDFVELIARTEGVCYDDIGSGGSKDAFPLTLLAKTRAITHLVDSYDTRHLDAKLQKSRLLLPDIRTGTSSRLVLNPSPRDMSRKMPVQPPNASQIHRGALTARY